jgi:hypothetical protein
MNPEEEPKSDAPAPGHSGAITPLQKKPPSGRGIAALSFLLS